MNFTAVRKQDLLIFFRVFLSILKFYRFFWVLGNAVKAHSSFTMLFLVLCIMFCKIPY
jgi:hypothetical protein